MIRRKSREPGMPQARAARNPQRRSRIRPIVLSPTHYLPVEQRAYPRSLRLNRDFVALRCSIRAESVRGPLERVGSDVAPSAQTRLSGAIAAATPEPIDAVRRRL